MNQPAKRRAPSEATKRRASTSSMGAPEAPEHVTKTVDERAEAGVLGALLASPQLFDEIAEILAPEDFGVRPFGDVYAAILAVDSAGKPVDTVTVADELRRAKRLDAVGGIPGLEQLITTSLDGDNIVAWAQIVSDKARLRRLHITGRELAAASIARDADADNVLEDAQTKIFALGETRGRSTMIPMVQAVPRTLELLAKARGSVLLGQPTGIDGLDRMTAGLQGGQLIILAARPGMGKSSFAAWVAHHIAQTSGKAVPFLSYEMSVPEIGMRLLASQLGYDLHRLRQGDLPAGMERDLAVTAERLAAVNMLIDDNPPETIGGVRAAMRRLARREPVGAIVVDYLQLMRAERRLSDENRTQEVSEISRGLKRLATELDVPVIALSQLNRQLEQRPNKRPQLSDLRESGSLEQDANAVIFLYRHSMYDASTDPTHAECIVAKQRNGPTGIVHLEFDAGCGRWGDHPNPPARQMAAPSRTEGRPF